MLRTLMANTRHALAATSHPVMWLLKAMFGLNFTRSMQPFAVTYFSFGRTLADFFCRLGLIEKTHPWIAETVRPRPVAVLTYANARVNWAKPFAMPAVITVSVTLLLTCAFMAGTSLGVGTLIGAGDAYASSFFAPTNPATDLGLKYMSNSFGITIPGVPTGTVDGLVSGFHKIMALYSSAMLVIAGFVLIYIILSVITATAHEGRFGGSSFHQYWAPIRLVVAIGLLVPLPMAGGYNGYNSGQYIVLKISEWGSGLATNLWVPFATALADRQNSIATPNVPATAAAAVKGVFLSEFCMERYNAIKAELGAAMAGAPPVTVQMPPPQNGRVIIYYGTGPHNALNNYCGQVMYEKSITPGIIATQISDNFEVAYNNMRIATNNLAHSMANDFSIISATDGSNVNSTEAVINFLAAPLAQIMKNYQNELALILSNIASDQSAATTAAMTSAIEDSGWAGAGMWFNTIARLNAEVMSAARSIPVIAPPSFATAAKAEGNLDIIAPTVERGYKLVDEVLSDPDNFFALGGVAPNTGAGNVGGVSTQAITAGLSSSGAGYSNNKALGAVSGRLGEYIQGALKEVPNNPFDQIGFGANTGLSQVNPLAQLAAIGDFMIMVALACINAAATPLISGAFMFVLIGLAGLTFSAGVLLFYVTPLMPFIRLLFGVAGWLLSILEAIIAIPLIALAHLNTRGEGISGDMARTGYMMIFSIFLRPALMIVGMIASLMMFIVAIGILNDAFHGAVTGLMGTGAANNVLSVVFYTIMYCVIAFGLCNLCFKLVEEIPNRAMGWIGQAAAREITEDDRVAKVLSGTSGEFLGISTNVIKGRAAGGAVKGIPVSGR